MAASRNGHQHSGEPIHHVRGRQQRLGHSGTPLDSAGQVLDALGALTWATRYARTRGGQIADLTRRGMENAQVSGHSDGQEWAPCKTVGLAYVGKAPG